MGVYGCASYVLHRISSYGPATKPTYITPWRYFVYRMQGRASIYMHTCACACVRVGRRVHATYGIHLAGMNCGLSFHDAVADTERRSRNRRLVEGNVPSPWHVSRYWGILAKLSSPTPNSFQSISPFPVYGVYLALAPLHSPSSR